MGPIVFSMTIYVYAPNKVSEEEVEKLHLPVEEALDQKLKGEVYNTLNAQFPGCTYDCFTNE